MTIPQHLALSFLLAQFGVQSRYGIGGTVLVAAAGVLPDLDRLSLLAGWHAHRTYRNAAGHGLPVTLAAPLLLGLLGSEVLQLGPLGPLWCWLQIVLVAHLVADVFSCRWPVKLLWPFSVRGWGFGLVAGSFPALTLLLYAAAGAALCSATLAPFAAAVGVAGLVVGLTWRACRLRTPLTRPTERGPVLWEGCDLTAWLRLLVRHRFAVHPSRWPAAAAVTLASFLNTTLWLVKCVCYDWSVRRMPVPQAPLFIIGHWRTGTTLLHDLLALDARHGCPSTYECLAPSHFLLTESWLPRLLWFLMPPLRPMDNMAAGWDRPQEDEFALCLLGQPSPYRTIAFPNNPPPHAALELEDLTPRALASWKRVFLHLLRQIAFRHPGKRLVLKSPTHTCRIQVLREMFPDARFVHIVRDPYVVVPSTVHLWKTLYQTHALQRPTFAGLEEHVFQTFTRLYDKLEATRGLVPPSQFYELRYEDLVRDPVTQVQALYAHLGLGDFDAVRPRLQAYLAAVAGYRTNRYDLSAAFRAEIARRCGAVIRRYDYGTESS